MTGLLLCHAFCNGDKCLYRLEEQANGNVTLCVMVRMVSVSAVHVCLV